jgi:hypothetical protein
MNDEIRLAMRAWMHGSETGLVGAERRIDLGFSHCKELVQAEIQVLTPLSEHETRYRRQSYLVAFDAGFWRLLRLTEARPGDNFDRDCGWPINFVGRSTYPLPN